MSNKIIFSVDVERDLHTNDYEGIRIGLKRFKKICDKHNVKPILFVVADCIKDNKDIFRRFIKNGWEISLHGYSHKRFDSLSYKEKESEIKKSIEIFKKHLNIKPRGFRAPQHSIDAKTLDLLKKYGFEYDSSFTPLNLLQFFFFPKKIGLNFKSFFSPLNEYKIRLGLKEKPVASLLVPFVSLSFRIFPLFLLRAFVFKIKLFYKNPVFYAHSWDFISLKDSRIDNLFPSEKMIRKIDKIMEYEK